MFKSKRDTTQRPSPSARQGEAATGPARSRYRVSLKRYVAWSTVVASTALAVSIAVSGIALSFAQPEIRRISEVSSATGTEVSFAFVEAINTRHEVPVPTPEPPRSPSGLSTSGRAPADYIVRGRIANVDITFYDCAVQNFCGAMYNGRKVYEGAAACSWNLAIGTKFVIVGDPTRRIYVCEDRGLLANTWVDIFFYHPADGYSWQGMVGRYGTIEIVN